MNELRPDLLIEIKNLKTHFRLPQGIVRAVDGADLAIHRGQTLGVVGESGCGKSVTAQSVLRIVPPPGEIVDGQILYHRQVDRSQGSQAEEIVDLAQMDSQGQEIRDIRGAEIAMIFQEPMTSLSVVHTIGNQIEEVIRLHQRVDVKEARARAIEMLDHVGMPQPDRSIDEYPFRLSGGMRQRAMIAMALSCHPQLLIADEPTTALDVTTEAQILDLMRRLQSELGMAIMFITHDLGVIAEMTEEVVVMYLGKVVESAKVVPLFHDPRHPYTQALLHSIPKINARPGGRLEPITGSVPDPYTTLPGCPFHPRCAHFMQGVCDVQVPLLIQVAPEHWVSCHLYSQEQRS
jgi:oligopeptide/dipeptide ABC transporter ATP-binding protein